MPINGLDFAWSFDDIGNRKTATSNGQVSTFSANQLKQYETRTVPGVIDVFGAAQPDATVTVTRPAGSTAILPTTRQGDQFYRQLTADNSTGARVEDITITGVKNNVGAAGEDAVTEVTREVFVPPAQEVFVHDADGNLTADSRWEYLWDGENRLVALETSLSAANTGVTRRRIEFIYDGQSRRIAKQALAWDAVASVWVTESSIRFVYDGWNLLAELDATGATLRTYAWGLDLSGSMQGAGGVGGLLFAGFQLQPSISTYAPAYDGNGNVIGYVDIATGTMSATYEYGAFGETLISEGPLKDSFPVGFSTKYKETDAPLLYYGTRYLDSSSGRWINRDTAGESGSANLFAFMDNDALTGIDFLGKYHVGKAKDNGANTVVTDGTGGLIIRLGNNDPAASPCIIDSIKIHEGVHRLHALRQNNAIGYLAKNGKPQEPQPAGLFLLPDNYSEQLLGEIAASEAQLRYLQRLLTESGFAKCACDLGEVARWILFVRGYQKAHEDALLRATPAELNGPPREVFKRHQFQIQLR